MENSQKVDNAVAEKTVNLANLTSDDSLNLLWNALNKASNQGVFTIDESYVIKVAHNKIKSSITVQNRVVAKDSVLDSVKEETL